MAPNQIMKPKSKMKIQFLVPTLLTACTGFLALTADPKNLEDSRYQQSRSNSERAGQPFRSPERLGPSEKATDLLGKEIKNSQDEKWGKLDELAIDLEAGRIVEAILSSGGVLGVGDTQVAVPPGILHWDSANHVIHLDADTS